MAEAEALQIVGSIAIAGTALMVALVASSWRGFCHYSREMLWACSAFVLFIAVIRLLVVPAGWITQTDARTINGLAGIVFFIGAGQTLFFHLAWHRRLKKLQCNREGS